MFPKKNFLGVDIKGDRIWRGLIDGKEKQLQNFAFLRARIENLTNFIGQNEISEIWITFPDPRPKPRDTKRRLTSHRFLEMYQEVLKPNGVINLKTDNTDFFDFSLDSMQSFGFKILNQTKDLYNSELQKYTFEIKTRYEKQFWESCGGIKFLQVKIV